MLISTVDIDSFVSFLVLTIILLASAAYYRLRQHLLRVGERVEGTVIRLEADENDLETQRYYPVVRFHTSRGVWLEARYTHGPEVPAYVKGQTVTVLYDPDHPTRFVLGATPVSTWEWGMLALTVGVLAYCVYASLNQPL
ncbi:DUF3592 domain-containing protein [Hymenobacter persicinus]|uniref:DUF3592 domain-containing protein n=1 Tax=Hymenobacter persicinus TaxID=2025506 RepID=A0A4Q5LFA7_9BACT|nr:DUF3592 domain-containing protein [Hymenobacter persicinus]RYU81825.1 DUF3592 domain-containing protein [Hymenobacter persicinus]